MTTPKAIASNFLYAKLINKKRNQSSIEIEKDLNQLEQQQQGFNENRKLEVSELISENTANQNSNNYSFDQNKNPNNIQSSKQSDPYEDNMNYINSLMQIKKQNEVRNNQKKANHHARTKSSLGQYSATSQIQNQQLSQNDLNASANNHGFASYSKNSQEKNPLKNSTINHNNQDSKDNSLLMSQQPLIQQKSLSHRSLNETLPIFSKMNKNNSGIENNGDVLQKSTQSVAQNNSKGQGQHNNNLSFKIDSERKNIQHQYQHQQQMNKFNNQESSSANETNHSTGISQQKTDQAQFLQFLGNYVTYLSQPDESPSQISSSKPNNNNNNNNNYQNNFFNSHNSSINANNRYYQPYQQMNSIQIKNEQLIQENLILKESFENLQHQFKEVSYQNKLQMIEINKLIKEKGDDKKKIIQSEKVVSQIQLKYNDILFKLKHTQDNLAKLTIDRENDHYTLKYALQQLQSQQMKNTELSTFKSNSKNSYSSHNFNFTSKGRESNHDLKFDEFENNSHFFSIHNQKPVMGGKVQSRLKSPMNLSKMTQNGNRQNFQQQEIIYDGEQILNNTGIFNYPNQHIIGEEEDDIEKHNTSMKIQARNQNVMNFGQIQGNEQDFEYANEGNIYNNFNDSDQQFDYDELQHSQNADKQSFINNNNNNNNNNYNSANQMQQQRNKKYHSMHMRNPSSDENHNINSSYYQNFLQNKMINEIENKNGIFSQNGIQKNSQKDISYKGKKMLKNSSINNSQSSKINFNNSNMMIPSGDYYQDISQSELQNNSLQIHQIE